MPVAAAVAARHARNVGSLPAAVAASIGFVSIAGHLIEPVTRRPSTMDVGDPDVHRADDDHVGAPGVGGPDATYGQRKLRLTQPAAPSRPCEQLLGTLSVMNLVWLLVGLVVIGFVVSIVWGLVTAMRRKD